MWVLEEWTGNWSTIYLAANNENMVSENGPLRMNFCLLTSHPMVTLESPFIEGLIIRVKASASLQKKPRGYLVQHALLREGLFIHTS